MSAARIGAVRIPRPWESESDLRRLQGLDLHEMNAIERRLTLARQLFASRGGAR